MRRLVGLFLILVVFVVLDSAARSYASEQAEGRLASALNFQGNPSVEIGGFPFVWGLLRGRVEDVTIRTGRIRSDPLELSQVKVVLRDVSFPVSEVVSGQSGKLTVASAGGSARISAPTLEAALSGLPVDASSLLEGSRKLDITGNQIDLGVTQVALPVIAEGVQYESAELTNGAVRLRFGLERTSFAF